MHHWYSLPGLAIGIVAFFTAVIALIEKPGRWTRAVAAFVILLLTVGEIRNLVSENQRVTDERGTQDKIHVQEIHDQLAAIKAVGDKVAELKVQRDKTDDRLAKAPKSLKVAALELSNKIVNFLMDSLIKYPFIPISDIPPENTGDIEAFHHRHVVIYRKR